jgi:hypothetical protein
MNLFTWLLTAIGPLVVRVVAALGFTAVTYSGVTLIVTNLVTFAQSSWAALPVAVLQLATLSGIPQVMGMIFGAYLARVSMWAIGSATKYIMK